MSNRNYVCAKCGALRRASAVYRDPHRETWAEAIASPRWPKHCEQPMIQMSFVQAEGATQLAQEERVKWVAKGMHVMRHQGKHSWKPVTTDRQIEEVKSEKAEYQTRSSGR